MTAPAIRAGLSFYVGRRLPVDFLALAAGQEVHADSWAFPSLDDSMPGEPPVERLAALGRSLRDRATQAG